MRLSLKRVRDACHEREISLAGALREARVSRNAFYTLTRKDSVVPRTVLDLAAALRVDPSDLLESTPTPSESMHRLMAETKRILSRCAGADYDNVRHTLLLLDKKPVERLRGALRRGRQLDIRRTGS